VTQLPDVRPALAAHPQQGAASLDLEGVEFVHLPDAEVPADGAFPGGLLIDRPLELGEHLPEVRRRGGVQFQDRDVLLRGALERPGGPRRRAGQRRQTPRHLRVERPRVGGVVDPPAVRVELANGAVDRVPDPGGDLVGRGSGRLVEVDDPEPEQFRGRPVGGRRAHQKS